MVQPAMSSASIVEAFNVLKDSGFSLYIVLKWLNNIEELAKKISVIALS
jgi:hypothetical protein